MLVKIAFSERGKLDLATGTGRWAKQMLVADHARAQLIVIAKGMRRVNIRGFSDFFRAIPSSSLLRYSSVSLDFVIA
jgi:hypothetical protein